MDQLNIQWYPGHMTKARRMMEESLHQVDALCEILDARIPNASRNPEIDSLAAGKPRLIVLNRSDLADPALTKRWKQYYEAQGFAVLDCDARSGKGCGAFAPAVRRLLSERLEQWQEKGQTGRKLRVMVAGIPNVGKSTFINRIAGRKAAAAGDRPGVTRGKQWIAVDNTLELLDTPWAPASCSACVNFIRMRCASATSWSRILRPRPGSCWNARHEREVFSFPAGKPISSGWRTPCSPSITAENWGGLPSKRRIREQCEMLHEK